MMFYRVEKGCIGNKWVNSFMLIQTLSPRYTPMKVDGQDEEQELTLRKKCLHSGLFWSAFFQHFPLLRISPNLVRMWENAGMMRTRITPNTDTFYAVLVK